MKTIAKTIALLLPRALPWKRQTDGHGTVIIRFRIRGTRINRSCVNCEHRGSSGTPYVRMSTVDTDYHGEELRSYEVYILYTAAVVV